MIHTKNKGMK